MWVLWGWWDTCHMLFAGRRNRDFALFQICAILIDHIWDSHADQKELSGSMPRLNGVWCLNSPLGSAALFWSIELFVIVWSRIEFRLNAMIHTPFIEAEPIKSTKNSSEHEPTINTVLMQSSTESSASSKTGREELCEHPGGPDK